MNKPYVSAPVNQRELTAVIERFSRKHDKGVFGPNQKKYEELIPKESPGQGQQYAFEVDLDKCTGCKACVTACHSENGLDEDETWRSVGLVSGGTSSNPAIQHITSACHHCVEPACMKGCPTLAYEKDEATGIVKHLEDQCFGCQYCILKCPYDVPKYNKKRGIVHKCDMCITRLDAGQAPACARACPTGAIRITLVDSIEVKRNSKEYVKVPDAPASNYTYPTTKYITKKNLPTNMESVDYYDIKPEHAHFPLVIMLVLTQLSVGAFCAEYITEKVLNTHYLNAFHLFHAPIALGIGLLALASSILHLGRPHLAFRAILGFRTSWLSREIIAFTLFAGLAIVYALSFWLQPLKQLLTRLFFGVEIFNILAFSVLISGILGIVCSIMVYRDTKRPFWDNHLTTIKFFMTSIILGSATVLVTSTILGISNAEISFLYITQYIGTLFCKVILLATGIKLVLESTMLFFVDKNNVSFIDKTALLMLRQLRTYTFCRFGCSVAGGLFLPLLFLQMNSESAVSSVFILTVCIFGLTVAGEILERYLFFRAAVPLKMPGGKIR